MGLVLALGDEDVARGPEARPTYLTGRKRWTRSPAKTSPV